MDRLRVSVSECTTFHASFEDDLTGYSAAGADGIGIWEFKLPAGDDARSLERMQAAGLDATICVPTIPSIYPDGYFAEPKEPADRTKALCAAIRRFAPFKPVGILCVTGDPAGRDRKEMWRVTVDGLKEVADVAGAFGVTLGVEAYRATSGALVNTIDGMLELVGAIDRPNVGIIIDTWHLWDDEDFFGKLTRHADQITGVQVCDYRNPSRSWADRVLPGDGVIDWPAVIAALDAGGYDGWYDVEIFSDDGTFGAAYPDSYWAAPAAETVAAARAAFDKCWSLTPQQVKETR
jgi:sugar phosphate isomerase/epimerase